MNIFNIMQAGITLFLSVAPWFFPDCAWYIKVIILLCVLLSSAALSCLRLLISLRNVSKSLDELQIRHNALADQYDEKRNQEKNYRLLLNNMSNMFCVAIANTKQAKISELYKFFLMMQQELSGGIIDEQTVQNRQDHQ